MTRNWDLQVGTPSPVRQFIMLFDYELSASGPDSDASSSRLNSWLHRLPALPSARRVNTPPPAQALVPTARRDTCVAPVRRRRFKYNVRRVSTLNSGGRHVSTAARASSAALPDCSLPPRKSVQPARAVLKVLDRVKTVERPRLSTAPRVPAIAAVSRVQVVCLAAAPRLHVRCLRPGHRRRSPQAASTDRLLVD